MLNQQVQEIKLQLKIAENNFTTQLTSTEKSVEKIRQEVDRQLKEELMNWNNV